MKVFICLLAATLVGALAANRPSFEIEPLNWTSHTTANFPFASFDASKDLLVYFVYESDAAIAIRRRNGDGGYDLVANITNNQNLQVHAAHGKWIWIQNDETVAIQSINSKNQLSEQSFITSFGGSVLSDDTFVGFVPLNNTAGQIVSYQYQASNNTWTVIEGAEVEVGYWMYSAFDLQSYRAYDNHLVFADVSTSSVNIYQRQADKSWKLNDTIPVDTWGTDHLGVHFNGVDTVVFVAMATLSDDSQGVVYIYTKKDGVWSEQMFNTTSVGYVPQGNLGASCAFIDQNTLLLSAATADFYKRTPFQIGKVLMMTRTNGGDWTPYLDIIGNDSDVFGMSIAVNDYDLVVYDVAVSNPNYPAGRFRVYTAPLCFAQPINVTCKNEQISNCSLLNTTELYTINYGPSCGEITSLMTSRNLTTYKLQASFTFTRFETETFSCNATVTCPVPVVPVAVSVPVKAPTAKTSDGSMIQCFGLAVLSLCLAVF